MAINPLMLFAGLSAATVGGIVVVQQVNQSKPIDRPAVAKKQSVPLSEPVVTRAPKTITKKLTAIAPESFPPAKLEEKAFKKTVPIAPSFDIVRVEKDGGAVVVGKAAPNASISLKLNGKVIGNTKSNKQGDWVFIPEKLIPSGNHEMVVEAQESDKNPVRSTQSIFIALPKGANQKPLVVVTNRDTPTKVLQVPDGEPNEKKGQKNAKEATEVADALSAPKSNVVPPQAKPKAQPQLESRPSLKPAKKPRETIIKQALAKPASALPNAVAVPKAIAVPKTSVVPTEKPKAKAVEPTPKALPQKVAKIAPKVLEKTNAEPIKKAKPLTPTKLVFGTVDYNDQGNIVFSGKAAAGKTVRLYIDNKVVGDARSDEKGNWVFKGKRSINAGLHELRADQLSATGKVTQRTAVPFVRAAARKVAALIKKRVKTKQEKTEPIVPLAKKPPQVQAKPKENGSDVSAPKALKQNSPAIVQTGQAEDKASVKADTNASVKANVEAVKKPAITQPIIAMKPPQPKQDLVSHVVIQPGNNLWNISRVIYGKGVAYTTIFQANKTQIKNPHRIYPGQILETPGAMSTGSIGPDQRESNEGGNG